VSEENVPLRAQSGVVSARHQHYCHSPIEQNMPLCRLESRLLPQKHRRPSETDLPESTGNAVSGVRGGKGGEAGSALLSGVAVVTRTVDVVERCSSKGITIEMVEEQEGRRTRNDEQWARLLSGETRLKMTKGPVATFDRIRINRGVYVYVLFFCCLNAVHARMEREETRRSNTEWMTKSRQRTVIYDF